MLNINCVHKNFGGLKAVHNASMNVIKGSITGLIGPNGAGKTTLLRSINGLETASGGEIYFDHKIVNNNTISDVQKKTGMIFQEFNLVNNLSAIWFINFWCSIFLF